MDTPAAVADTVRSPLLLGLGASRGLAFVRASSPGVKKPGYFWLFHRINHDEPLAFPADLEFSRAVVRALREAVPWSAIDSTAFLQPRRHR